MAAHKITYKLDENYYKPHTLRCSCQFGGEFASKEDAVGAANTHIALHSGENKFSSEMVGFKGAATEAKPEDRKEVKAGGPLF